MDPNNTKPRDLIVVNPSGKTLGEIYEAFPKSTPLECESYRDKHKYSLYATSEAEIKDLFETLTRDSGGWEYNPSEQEFLRLLKVLAGNDRFIARMIAHKTSRVCEELPGLFRTFPIAFPTLFSAIRDEKVQSLIITKTVECMFWPTPGVENKFSYEQTQYAIMHDIAYSLLSHHRHPDYNSEFLADGKTPWVQCWADGRTGNIDHRTFELYYLIANQNLTDKTVPFWFERVHQVLPEYLAEKPESSSAAETRVWGSTVAQDRLLAEKLQAEDDRARKAKILADEALSKQVVQDLEAANAIDREAQAAKIRDLAKRVEQETIPPFKPPLKLAPVAQPVPKSPVIVVEIPAPSGSESPRVPRPATASFEAVVDTTKFTRREFKDALNSYRAKYERGVGKKQKISEETFETLWLRGGKTQREFPNVSINKQHSVTPQPEVVTENLTISAPVIDAIVAECRTPDSTLVASLETSAETVAMTAVASTPPLEETPATIDSAAPAATTPAVPSPVVGSVPGPELGNSLPPQADDSDHALVDAISNASLRTSSHSSHANITQSLSRLQISLRCNTRAYPRSATSRILSPRNAYGILGITRSHSLPLVLNAEMRETPSSSGQPAGDDSPFGHMTGEDSSSAMEYPREGDGEVIPTHAGYLAKCMYLTLKKQIESYANVSDRYEFWDMEGVIQEFVAWNLMEFSDLLEPEPDYTYLEDPCSALAQRHVCAFEQRLHDLMWDACYLWLDSHCPLTPLATFRINGCNELNLSAHHLMLSTQETKLKSTLSYPNSSTYRLAQPQCVSNVQAEGIVVDEVEPLSNQQVDNLKVIADFRESKGIEYSNQLRLAEALRFASGVDFPTLVKTELKECDFRFRMRESVNECDLKRALSEDSESRIRRQGLSSVDSIPYLKRERELQDIIIECTELSSTIVSEKAVEIGNLNALHAMKKLRAPVEIVSSWAFHFSMGELQLIDPWEGAAGSDGPRPVQPENIDTAIRENAEQRQVAATPNGAELASHKRTADEPPAGDTSLVDFTTPDVVQNSESQSKPAFLKPESSASPSSSAGIPTSAVTYCVPPKIDLFNRLYPSGDPWADYPDGKPLVCMVRVDFTAPPIAAARNLPPPTSSNEEQSEIDAALAASQETVARGNPRADSEATLDGLRIPPLGQPTPRPRNPPAALTGPITMADLFAARRSAQANTDRLTTPASNNPRVLGQPGPSRRQGQTLGGPEGGFQPEHSAEDQYQGSPRGRPAIGMTRPPLATTPIRSPRLQQSRRTRPGNVTPSRPQRTPAVGNPKRRREQPMPDSVDSDDNLSHSDNDAPPSSWSNSDSEDANFRYHQPSPGSIRVAAQAMGVSPAVLQARIDAQTTPNARNQNRNTTEPARDGNRHRERGPVDSWLSDVVADREEVPVHNRNTQHHVTHTDHLDVGNDISATQDALAALEAQLAQQQQENQQRLSELQRSAGVSPRGPMVGPTATVSPVIASPRGGLSGEKPIFPGKFHGKVQDVTLFCFQAGQFSRQYLRQNLLATHSDVIDRLSMFLAGEAFDWWHDIVTSGGPELNGIDSLEDFLTALKARFVQPSDSQDARTTLRGLKQGNMSIHTLKHKFLGLTRLVAVHQSPLDSTTQAEIFFASLNENIRERLRTCPIPHLRTDFNTLVTTCVQLEQMLDSTGSRNPLEQPDKRPKFDNRDRSGGRYNNNSGTRTNTPDFRFTNRTPDVQNHNQARVQRWAHGGGGHSSDNGGHNFGNSSRSGNDSRYGSGGNQWGPNAPGSWRSPRAPVFQPPPPPGRGRGGHPRPGSQGRGGGNQGPGSQGNNRVNDPQVDIDIPPGGPTFNLKGGGLKPSSMP